MAGRKYTRFHMSSQFSNLKRAQRGTSRGLYYFSSHVLEGFLLAGGAGGSPIFLPSGKHRRLQSMQPGCSWGCFVGEADSDGVCETPAPFFARSWCGAQQPAHVSCAHWTPCSLSFLPTTTEKSQDLSVWQTPLLTSLLGGNGMIKLMANRLIVTI